MLSARQAGGLRVLVDFTAIGAFFLASNLNHRVDPGDFIFLFVFENLIFFLVFFLFYLTFGAGYNYVLNYRKKGWKKFLKDYFNSLLGVLVLGLGGYVLVILMNQITVELLVAYLQDNHFQFQSIEILSAGGVFLEDEVVAGMQRLFGRSYQSFFWIMGINAFISMLLFTLAHPEFGKSQKAVMDNARDLFIKVLLSPALMLICCMLIPLLALIFGAQLWLLILILGLFRLLYLWASKKLSAY
ncbi:MAG: hypothetical protein EP338_09805 [Bacteroidetes bacterium]|nr:MAG: hypothetical protein EP338_09805 [Bacteroidota bacterium]